MTSYVSLLLAKQAELNAQLRRRDDIAVEPVADALDQSIAISNRDMAAKSLSEKRDLLLEVETALAAIKTGVYGVCLECGEAISAKRLAALPWASRCKHCQQIEEARS